MTISIKLSRNTLKPRAKTGPLALTARKMSAVVKIFSSL